VVAVREFGDPRHGRARRWLRVRVVPQHDVRRINTPFGVNEYAWQDVTGIYMQKIGTSWVMMMPIGGSMSICFQTSRMSLTFGRTWLPVASVDLPTGGASELLDTLIHTWEAATHADHGSDGVSGQLQDEPA
jgi:hypothetical protein